MKLGFGTLPTTPLSVTAGTPSETTVSITDDDEPSDRLRPPFTSPKRIDSFDPDVFDYMLGVDFTVTQSSITLTPFRDDDTVTFNGTVVTNGSTQTVDLAVGLNTFVIRVTSSGSDDPATYTVYIGRGTAEHGGWKAGDDLDTLRAAGNTDPTGVWSDGTTLWIADSADAKLYAYTVADGARDSSKDISLHSDNSGPAGIWSDETTIWVADQSNSTVFAYTLSDGSRNTSMEFARSSGNTTAWGIWSDGTTMWVVDGNDDKLYAYTLADGSRDSDKDFDLNSDNDSPRGIWSNGTTLWVVDADDNKLYAYDLSGTRIEAYDISLHSSNSDAVGIWGNSNTAWVVNSTDVDASPFDRVYTYNNIPVTVSFEQATYSVDEGRSVEVKVTLSADPQRTVTIPITRAHAGGASASDYSGVPANVVFTSSETEKTITLNAATDNLEDGGESVKLGLGTLPAGVIEGVTNEATVSILNVATQDSLTVSFAAAGYALSEGNTTTVTVSLNTAPGSETVIPLTTVEQGGASDADYSGVPASLTFGSNDTQKTFTFSATQDSVDDDDESVKIGFGTLPGGVSAGSTSETTVSINDDDRPSSVAVSFGSATYTAAEGGSVAVTVTLSEDPEQTVTIPITTAEQGGASSSDYSGVPSSVTFNAGETSKPITFMAAADTVDDDGESVKLGFGTLPTTPLSVTAGTPNETTISITDHDGPSVTVSFGSATYSVEESDDTNTTSITENAVTVTVTLSDDPERTVTLPITTANQGGASSADYSGVPANVVFNAGETSKTFTFTATHDTADDDGESVDLSFGSLPTGVSAETPDETTVTINDDDKPTSVSVSFGSAAYTAAEGGSVAVMVTLSDDPEQTVTIPITTANQGGATSADYGGVPASVVFNAGETSKTITFTAASDSVDDDGESVKLGFGTLPTTPLSVTAGSPSETTVTITDDDVPAVTVTFGAAAYSVEESDDTNTLTTTENEVVVTVTLSADPQRTVTIPITTANQGGATSADYSGVPANVEIASGQTSATFTFTATADTVDDDGESVKLSFGTLPTGVTAGTPNETTASINDDDKPTSVAVTFGAAAYTAAEGGSVAVMVTLSDDPEQTVTIPITTANQGGATSADYSGVPASVVFNAGDTSKTITFAATADSDNDDGESVKLGFGTLPTSPLTVTAGTPSETTVTITDDDVPSVTVSFGSATYTVTEGGSVTVTVTLSEDPEQTVTVPITTANQGGATAADYSGVPTSVVFNVGETSKTFTFAATDDSVDDDGESVELGFGSLPTRVTAGTPDETTVSITDDDVPTVSVSFGSATYSVEESDDTNTTPAKENEVVVTVTLSADPERTVTIPITKTNEGGASNSDYSGVPASVTFNAGETSKTFTFSATPDTIDEDGESVKLTFGTLPTGVTAGTPDETRVAINDDDLAVITVSYGRSTYTVTEGSTVTVTVTLSAAPGRTVTIPITAANQGGASSADYSGVPASVTFNAGETSKTFIFTATHDTADDDGESVKLAFGTLPTGVTAGTQDETTVTITDSLRVSFGASRYEAHEGGNNARVVVKLDRAATTPTMIPLTTTLINGVSNSDFRGVPSAVVFGVGERSKSFAVTAVDDTVEDDGEMIELGFGTLPNGIVAGSPSTAIVELMNTEVQQANRYQCEPDAGTTIVLDAVGEIRQAGEVDYWRVKLDPHRAYFIEVLGKLNGRDVMGQDTYAGDLTLENPVIIGVWDDGRNVRFHGNRHGNRFSLTRGATETGWHEIEVRDRNGGTGTYQIKVRINDICRNDVNGYENYPYDGGPDGYGHDVPGDETTRLDLQNDATYWRSLSGFLGDNWSWYRENEPDVDWVRVHLRANYEYTIELWTDEEYPVEHQATDLKILGIHNANGDLIPGTSSATSGKKVTVTFVPETDGEYYVAVGSGERDRTGLYKISIEGQRL